MRFRKGDKVEVLTQKEVPSGSWHSAEIICGNGHNYTVRYDGDMGNFGEAMLERVPRKSIRPCPPSVDKSQDWVPGDVIEVFHNFSWKMATVLEVLGQYYLLVGLLGSGIEFKASKYDVRARLCWQDGEWIVMGKASNKCQDLRFRLPSSRNHSDLEQKMGGIMTECIKGDGVGARNSNSFLEAQPLPSITLKRKPFHFHSQIEAYARPAQKTRVGEKESMWHQVDVLRQPLLSEKVDDAASSQEIVGKKYKHPPFNNRITGCSEMILEREKIDADVRRSRSISLESIDDDSVSSSIGSCSVHRNYFHKLRHVFAVGPFADDERLSSDAESFYPSRYKERNYLLPAKQELTEEIHRLELHAYRCTIKALHASGPLSWEQELLLTNLRDSLHISNDEHLKEIRNLISSSACIPSS